jgi:NADH-quinone oxidoreductase subunit G
MPKLSVNGTEVEFDQGMTVLQACEVAGEEIPRFCYHERLEIAGNCRMCLVQIEGGPPKPAASCAMPAAEGMKIHTNTPMVKKAREGVMEFLLINHPLDCPICDQGGECDLQDQAMTYGRGESRYGENKRSVKEKYMGPLVKTHMTRCIQCTRCVRFLDDISGIQELGAVNRGEHMEISTYVEKSLTSELSGNIIDLCPVGALTSKPYAFKARSWELRKTESIDVMDAVGSNIRIDARGREVMRVMPRLNEEVNEEWLDDKARFSYDGLKLQRLDRPYVRKNGRLAEVSWEEALAEVANHLRGTSPEKIGVIAGDQVDVETMFSVKKLAESYGIKNIDCRADGADISTESRASYLFNTTIAGVEQADACLLIGTNPRWEAPIINARLRKSWLASGLKTASVGAPFEPTFPVEQLGDSPETLKAIADGSHPFAKILEAAEHPMLILGSGVFTRDDAKGVEALARTIAEKYGLIKDEWNGYNVLHRAASRVGGLDIDFVPEKGGKSTREILAGAEKGDIEMLYLLGADDIDAKQINNKTFVVYQGHHGDAGAHRADVILPGAAYTEKNATFVNTEGRVQRTRLAVFAPGEAKQDWKIIAELAAFADKPMPYGALSELRAAIESAVPHLANVDEVTPAEWNATGANAPVSNEPFKAAIANYYLTDPISRASSTMAKCVSDILEASKQGEAA